MKKVFKILSFNKLIVFNIFLLTYFIINAFTGEKGIISIKNKDKLLQLKNNEERLLFEELNILEHKNKMLSININNDYLDEIYRDIFVVGKKNEELIIIHEN